MAKTTYFIKNGIITLNPVASDPTPLTKGQVFVSDSDGLLSVYDGTVSRKTVNTTSTQTLTNKTLTSPVITSPTGLTKSDVGLGNVDDTSDASKNAAVVTLTNKTLTAPVIATIVNSGTLSLPTSTDTLVGKATTDTLTNKTLTSPVIATIVNSGTLSLPTSTDTLVGRATTDTLTNKTLTAPVIATIVNSGTLSLPTSTDTLVGKATTDTLTNKTLTGSVVSDNLNFNQTTTPSNPSAGSNKIYCKADNKFYSLTSTGVEQNIGGGPSLGLNSIIRTNAKTIDENITFAGTENGSSVGPITISSGFTVTVTSGSTWVIL